MEWPAGNWVTMGNPDTYPARLNGTVIDAPTGTVLTFRFPPSSPNPDRIFVVPPADPNNPTCLGLPVDVSEPFVIPPGPTDVFLDVLVPEECSTLKEGAVVQFLGQAIADVGAPGFQPGETIVSHVGTCVVDNTPPQVEQLNIVPLQDGLLDIRVEATDTVTTPLEALLRFHIDGGSEQRIPMDFDEPPVVGNSAFFRATIGPFPPGSSVEVTVDVFDDVANSVTSPTIVVEIKPVPGDLDADGDVDMDDLNIVVNCFGQTVANNPACAIADVAPPPDGIINILDISFVGSNFTP